jgi:hypothetical protein
VTGLTYTEVVQANQEDNIYTLTGGTNLTQRIQVNDRVRFSETGPNQATVLSVSDTAVVIDSRLNSASSTLYFVRKTVDITSWFQAGFTSLKKFAASNCKLSGSLNVVTTLPTLSDDSSFALDLSTNMLSGYVIGSLSNIFLGNPRKITVNLSYNSLPIEAIKSVINEVFTLDSLNKFSNCKVLLSYNKLDSNNKYTPLVQNELFPVSSLPAQTLTTPLFRTEEFKIYNTITVYDENGAPSEQRIQVGTRVVQIPGALVSGTYYKNKVDTIQQAVEDPAAVKFKSLTGITIDLGFTYQSPNTTPVISNTTYTTPTTRNSSISEVINPDTGDPYDPNDLV